MFFNKQKTMNIYFKMTFMKSVQIEYQSTNINQSLSLIERVVLYNLNLYSNVEDKINYLEKFYSNLIQEVFFHKNYIIETFKYRYSGKIIVETKNDVKEKIYEFHSFIKRAIKFDYLNEQQNQNYNDLFKDAPSFKTMEVQGNQNPTAQSNSRSVRVLKQIGWDKFFETLRDGFSSTIYSLAQDVASFLFPAVATGMKITGTIGWGVLLLWDLYKGRTAQSVIDFFLAACQFIPGVLGKKTNQLAQLGKKWASRGVEALDNIIKEVLDFLGLKEGLAKFIASILGVYEKLLTLIKDAANWIVKQLGNVAQFLVTAVQATIDFVNKIKVSLENFAQGVNQIKPGEPMSYNDKITMTQAVRRDSTNPTSNVNQLRTKL